ncbi:murein hydrolase activator EnvC family protein [Chloroherpeton thalassium]|nr:peptidoglycan DD-metalloendopeptidase family protein [Chloroherpeton thalassium]
MKLAFLLSILLVCSVSGFSAENSKKSDIQKISKERLETEQTLKLLQKQVDEYEAKFSEASESEKKSIETLKNLSTQLLLYKEIVSKLTSSQRKLRLEIRAQKQALHEAEKDLARMKADFARYAVAIYKFGEQKEIEVLFSSKSVNQALVRREYIKRFSDVGKLKMKDIELQKEAISKRKALLQAQYQESQSLLNEKRETLASYQQRKKEKETLLSNLRKNKRLFKKQITESQEKSKLLQKQIQQLIQAEEVAIREEIARKKREEAERRRLMAKQQEPNSEKHGRRSDVALELEPAQPMLKESASDFDYSAVSIDFDKNRGRLPWPVGGGVIVQAFGKNEDKDLKIVTFNNGVDISVPIGSSVHAVAGGKVTQIAYLPTFGNIVIIRHSNSYITVYANLADIRVTNGEVIRSGQVIGVSSKMTEGGSILHFEVWKGRDKCDPEVWLAKK